MASEVIKIKKKEYDKAYEEQIHIWEIELRAIQQLMNEEKLPLPLMKNS